VNGKPDHDALFTANKRTQHRDCAFCRNAETRALEGKRFGFVCRIGRIVMDAPTCPDFKDARKPSVAGDG
jgi:hypothetical protein